jgi:hypothetical protein
VKVEIRFQFELRKASAEICAQFNKPTGTYEVVDTENERLGFFPTESSAMDFLYGIALDAGLGEFVIE